MECVLNMLSTTKHTFQHDRASANLEVWSENNPTSHEVSVMRHSEPISPVVCMRSRDHSLARPPTNVAAHYLHKREMVHMRPASQPGDLDQAGTKSCTTTLVAQTHAATKSSTSDRIEDDEVLRVGKLGCKASYMPRTQMPSMGPIRVLVSCLTFGHARMATTERQFMCQLIINHVSGPWLYP